MMVNLTHWAFNRNNAIHPQDSTTAVHLIIADLFQPVMKWPANEANVDILPLTIFMPE